MAIYLIAVGFISILGQVVILRELSVAFYGVELIYILSIGLWLAGTSIGASIGRRNFIPEEKNIQWMFFFSALLLIADVVFIRAIRIIFQGVPGGYLPFFTQLFAMAAALIPLSIITGLLFQWTAKRFVSYEGTLAKAYSIESLGGIFGGLASTLLLYAGLQNFSIAIICAIFSLGVITFFSLKKSFYNHDYIFSLSLLLSILFFFSSQYFDNEMTRWNYPYLVESKDTPYNRITITSMEKQVSVFEDGALLYENESTSAEEFIQLSTLHADKLESVLVLGNGFSGIITELLKLPVKKIDYVEINRDIISTLQKYSPRTVTVPLSDSKVNIIYRDPREFIQKTSDTYDAILVCMPEPSSAQSNRFYTKEFFRECSFHLKPGAIFSLKIHSSENLWTSNLKARNQSIYNALNIAFQNIIVLPGTDNIFIASKSHLTSDPGFLTLRFNERKPPTKLVTPEYIHYIYTNDRFSGVENLLNVKITNSEISEVNSDIKPACYSYTLSIWLSKFFSSGISGTNGGYTDYINRLLSSVIFWSLIVVALIIAVIVRKFLRLRKFLLVAFAGFIGMILETILLLNYQSRSGILYRDIGVLLMTFMAGLTIGSFAVNKFLTSSEGEKLKRYWAAGILLTTGFCILNILVYFLIEGSIMKCIMLTSLALMLDGIFVAAIFSFASLYGKGESQAKMIPLYSADLLGGCLGSAAASLVFITVYGILATSLYMAAAALFATIFVF